MYEITLYEMTGKRSRSWPQEVKAFPSFEAFVIWEKPLDWDRYWHNGELVGKEEHADWYAHKNFGHWYLMNRTLEE